MANAESFRWLLWALDKLEADPGEVVDDEELDEFRKAVFSSAFEMCDDTHASCNGYGCLVYELCGGVPNELDSTSGCDVFKDGVAIVGLCREKLEGQDNG